MDSDIASRVRDLVIEYVKKKYGEKAVCCILTKGSQMPKAAIRNAARLLGSERYNDTKTFLSLGDEIAKAVPNTVGTVFKSKIAEDSDTTCYEQLVEDFKENKNALTVLENAKLMEGRLQNTGMHAAGVIISDGNPVSDYVPLLWNNDNERWVAQCDMVQAESKGLLKMDFLGLKNLDIITDALRYIKAERGIEVDILNVPLDDKKTFEMMSQGLTNGVFQFESAGMKNMLQQFHPDRIEDLILLVAAYRPGPMQYLSSIIKVKQGKEKVKYLTPELKPILETTYGSIIYQEQVQRIFQTLAGYSLGQADLVRRAMSKKKMSVLEKERLAFIEGDPERKIKGCIANGISKEIANELFDQMTEFAKYAFNKSHAAAYAIVAYMTAYLKANYSCEYLCATMNWTTLKKIPGLMNDCKKFAIEVLPPSINDSNDEFSINNNAILFGLKGIKNVGNGSGPIIEERRRNGKFKSFKDFIERGHMKKDVTESLIGAGAFDMFGKNRYAMTMVIEDLAKYSKKIKEKNELLIDLQKLTNDETYFESLSEKDKKALLRKVGNAEKSLAEAKESFAQLMVPTVMENKKVRLNTEKELLGVYVSGHPLDEYASPAALHCTPIEELIPGKKKEIFGLISELRMTKRKSDGAPMAFFTLEDKTDNIEVNCFTKAFANYGEFIQEGAVVKLSGTCFEEESFFDDSDEMVKRFNLEKIEEVKPIEKTIAIHVDDIVDWTENVYEKVMRYKATEGLLVVVHDRMLGEYRRTNLHVSPEILTNRLGIKVNIL